jgi:hypothetical protein
MLSIVAGRLLASPEFAHAACEFVVDPSGGGTHQSIQAAVDDLPNPGPCTVVVKPGTYTEMVTFAGKNSAAQSDAQRIVVAAGGPTAITAPGDHAVVFSRSKFITLQGFAIVGARNAGIVVVGGYESNVAVTIFGNDVHNNGGGGIGGGIAILGRSIQTWVVNNLIRQNGRNGVVVAADASESVSGQANYIVNNTIFGNSWNGVSVGRRETVYLVNNLIVGNGQDRGVTGGRWGVMRDSVSGPGSPATITLLHNVFYTNGAGKAPGHGGDIANASQTLDATDAGNYITTAAEQPGVAGCTFSNCTGAASFATLFDPPGYGPTFRLVGGSPAVDRGLTTFFDDGKEWVPFLDFDGHLRREDGDVDRISRIDVGYDELAHVRQLSVLKTRSGSTAAR